MRELEFLPGWYAASRQRRRRLIVQGWLAAVAAAGALLWAALVHRNVRDAEAAVADVAGRLSQTRVRLDEMDHLTEQHRHWARQERMMTTLGLQVEATRVIRTLDAAMPHGMSFASVQFDTDERAGAAGAAGVDRRLKVRVRGVCPAEADLAGFTARLGAVPLLEQVAVTAARDAATDGRAMREFEVTFSMNLNAPAGL